MCFTAVSSAAKMPSPPPDVVKLLPRNGDVKGWTVYPGTIVYASGKDLTEIYDGGFELYTKNGEQRIGLSVIAEQVVALRGAKKASPTKAADDRHDQPQRQERQPEPQRLPMDRYGGGCADPALNDEIPF
jgi:hypothetical protein